jgi:prepilin signal peptidase PulO-like enzyme (type II secretory pathway)
MAGMKTQLLDMCRRNARILGAITGVLIGQIMTSIFHNRSANWLATFSGALYGVLMLWGIQRLWAWRKGRRDMGEMKIVAAIVVAGICQIVFLALLISRGLKPQGIGIWIAPLIMFGTAAIHIWKRLNPTTA